MYVLLVNNKDTFRLYKKILHKTIKRDTACTIIKIKRRQKKMYIIDRDPSTILQEVGTIVQEIEHKLDSMTS